MLAGGRSKFDPVETIATFARRQMSGVSSQEHRRCGGVRLLRELTRRFACLLA
jgi:hypothetical protein